MKCLALKHENCQCNLCNGSVVVCLDCNEYTDIKEAYQNKDETGHQCEDCYIEYLKRELENNES